MNTLLRTCCAGIGLLLLISADASALSVRDTVSDWIAADPATQLKLAENIAATVHDEHPQITGTYLFKCMNQMIEGMTPAILRSSKGSKILDLATICGAMAY